MSETDQNEARARRQILKAWNYVKWNINWSKLFLGVATSNHQPAAIPGHRSREGDWLLAALLQHHTSQGIWISMYFNEDPTATPLPEPCCLSNQFFSVFVIYNSMKLIKLSIIHDRLASITQIIDWPQPPWHIHLHTLHRRWGRWRRHHSSTITTTVSISDIYTTYNIRNILKAHIQLSEERNWKNPFSHGRVEL